MRIEWMTREAFPQAVTSRRGFLKAGAAATGGLVLGFFLPGSNRFAQAAEPAKVYAPNAFLRVAPDNTITVIVNRLEFGQGVQTSLPMLIAEEMDADWSQMRGELAPAGEVYKDPAFGIQITGGSGSISRSYIQYREIGARARAMLVAAAAEQWKVAPAQLRTEKGMVIGPAGQKASYGSLAEAAMKQPVPATVTLKEPKQFRYIGKPTRRTDARAKSTGRQQFGIDFKPANAKTVLVARPPVFGAKVARVDAAAARAVKGVLDVFEVDLDRGARGVAVVAEGYWPAKQGRDALQIEWDSAAAEKIDSGKQMAEYVALAKAGGGALARQADVSKLAASAQRISAVYEFPYLAHAPMEPLNCVVELKGGAPRRDRPGRQGRDPGLGPQDRRPVDHGRHPVRTDDDQERRGRHHDRRHGRTLRGADAAHRAGGEGQRAGAVVALGGLDPHRLRDGNPDRRGGAPGEDGPGGLPQEADG